MFEGTSSDDTSNPFATPVGSLMHSTRDTYMEEPPSFASFVNSSPSPDDGAEKLDDIERNAYNSQDSNNALQQADGNRQHRQSQVARKVNSGFEILRPGSFSHQQGYVADWSEKAGLGTEHQRELDAHGNKRHSRKLQRKRADSKESRFKEEV